MDDINSIFVESVDQRSITQTREDECGEEDIIVDEPDQVLEFMMDLLNLEIDTQEDYSSNRFIRLIDYRI